MSDSEAKAPAKKAPAKKAAKKNAKAKKAAAVKTATDIAAGPEGDQVLGEVHERIEELNAEAQAAGVPVLHGATTVSLHIPVEDAITPVDAVNQVLHEITMNGLRGYTFVVRDETTQEFYTVRDGRIQELNLEASGD